MKGLLTNRLIIVYELFMAILALVSVFILINENQTIILIDRVIWLIFVIDVVARFVLSKNKFDYLKKNPLDLVAIIPFDSIFRLARLARLIRVARSLLIFRHYLKPIIGILRTNNLDKVLLILTVVIFVSSIPIRILEPTIQTYTDAVWWAIVTATTVGYGDISPETIIGRLIAIFLMIFGIGLLGLVTSSIATYFLQTKQKEEDSTIVFLKSQISRIDELSDKEMERLIAILTSYRRDNQKTEHHT